MYTFEREAEVKSAHKKKTKNIQTITPPVIVDGPFWEYVGFFCGCLSVFCEYICKCTLEREADVRSKLNKSLQ